MYEAAPVALPIEETAIFCNSRSRIAQIGEAYREGEEVGAVFVGIAANECLLAPIEGFIVERGDTYGHAGLYYQAVGVSFTRTGRATLWFLTPVLKA